MVNVPFVSEEFQRAFRNTFRGQVNSGRDLHVSDIVIPVVDFTPTASGTSLPESLRYAINRNSTSIAGTTAIGTTSLGLSNGFYRIQANIFGNSGGQKLEFLLVNPTINLTLKALYLNATTNNEGQSMSTDFIVYQEVGDALSYSMGIFSGSAFFSFTVTPIADVNGNIINPSGYDPQ